MRAGSDPGDPKVERDTVTLCNKDDGISDRGVEEMRILVPLHFDPAVHFLTLMSPKHSVNISSSLLPSS